MIYHHYVINSNIIDMSLYLDIKIATIYPKCEIKRQSKFMLNTCRFNVKHCRFNNLILKHTVFHVKHCRF